ncbi:MAG TPA: GGDEF domain-containing protein [Patescibacteria group bacterium]|nr:GGDEF domain-containing protein [Patescibacteria group bacterium]
MAEDTGTGEITRSGLPQGRFGEIRKQYEPIRPHVNAVVEDRKAKGYSNRDLHTTRHIAAEAAHSIHQEDQGKIEEFKRLAGHDGLTGLLSRRFFNDLVQERINHNRRFGTGYLREERRQVGSYPDYLAAVDANDFKTINDTKGHLVGDQVLQGIAKILSSGLREDDKACRFGGDEFLLFLRNVRSEADAMRILEEKRKAVQEANIAGTGATITVGLTAVEPDHRTVSDAFEVADERLYAAKEAGKNKVFGSKEMEEWRRRPVSPQLTKSNG